MAADADIAVIGSTPLALVLAGLLAREHGKQVVLVGDAPSPLRIDRDIDLSLGPITRPETWLLLERSAPETARTLGQIGRGVVARATVAILADQADTAIGLQHVHNMGLGFGHAAERLAGTAGAPGGVAFRDVRVLRRSAFNIAIEDWLAASGVRRIAPRSREVILRRDGIVAMSDASGTLSATLGILADDAAILAHLDPEERDPILEEGDAVAILTSPVRRLPQPIALYPDRDLWLRQHGSRAISALAFGDSGSAARRLGASLPAGQAARRAGEAVFRVLRPNDGAPLVGRPRGTRVLLIAGLGPTGLFQASALARLVANTASDAEQAYFAAREPGRGAQRAQVAEFTAARPQVAA